MTLEMRVLERAAEILGGELALAHALNVACLELARWRRGDEKPPQPVFLQAVDILVEYNDISHLYGLDAAASQAPKTPAD